MRPSGSGYIPEMVGLNSKREFDDNEPKLQDSRSWANPPKFGAASRGFVIKPHFS